MCTSSTDTGPKSLVQDARVPEVCRDSLQESKADRIPGILDQKNAAIASQEQRLTAMRQLLPEWARMNHLQTSIIAETTARQQELEEQSSSESAAASSLHEEVQKLKTQDEVGCLCMQYHFELESKILPS